MYTIPIVHVLPAVLPILPNGVKVPNGVKSLCNACGLRYARSQARKSKKDGDQPTVGNSKKGKIIANPNTTTVGGQAAPQGSTSAATGLEHVLPPPHGNFNPFYNLPSSPNRNSNTSGTGNIVTTNQTGSPDGSNAPSNQDPSLTSANFSHYSVYPPYGSYGEGTSF